MVLRVIQMCCWGSGKWAACNATFNSEPKVLGMCLALELFPGTTSVIVGDKEITLVHAMHVSNSGLISGITQSVAQMHEPDDVVPEVDSLNCPEVLRGPLELDPVKPVELRDARELLGRVASLKAC